MPRDTIRKREYTLKGICGTESSSDKYPLTLLTSHEASARESFRETGENKSRVLQGGWAGEHIEW